MASNRPITKTIGKKDSELLQQGDKYLGARQYAQAIEAYKNVIARGVRIPNIYCNMAVALDALGQDDLTEKAYRDGLAIDGKHVVLLSNLGIFLAKRFRFKEAEPFARKAVALKPNFPGAHLNLAILLSQSSRMDEAVTHFEKAAQLEPDSPQAAAALLFNLNYLPSTSIEQIFEQSKKVGLNWAKIAPPFAQWPQAMAEYTAPTHTHRPQKLKIGFLSGDLCFHPVGVFLADVLHQFDKNSFEWHAFSCHDSHDKIAQRLRSDVHHWHSLANLNDRQAAEHIRNQGIHILIDLSGHVSRNRMGIMALKPAPIQASWLGWFCTTGLPTIDYLITDAVSAPAGMDGFFTEKLYRLPDTRFCLSRPDLPDAVSALPAATQEHVTFGCVQNAVKINHDVLLLWAEILNTIPNAQLRIQGNQFNHERLRQVFIERAQAAGIDISRMALLPFTTWEAYMRNYAHIDILLDSHPYTGGTTTAEALWMGVPTITRTGATMIANQGASLMSAAGLSDWVTHSPEAYVAKAVDWANRVAELSTLRQGLREQVSASPLYQPAQFARQFEQALETFWLELPKAKNV